MAFAVTLGTVPGLMLGDGGGGTSPDDGGLTGAGSACGGGELLGSISCGNAWAGTFGSGTLGLADWGSRCCWSSSVPGGMYALPSSISRCMLARNRLGSRLASLIR